MLTGHVKRAKEAKTNSGNLTPRQQGVSMVQVDLCDTISNDSKNARPRIITQVEWQVEDRHWSVSLHVRDLLQLRRQRQCLRTLCEDG